MAIVPIQQLVQPHKKSSVIPIDQLVGNSSAPQRPDRFKVKSADYYEPGTYSYTDAVKDSGKTLINSLANLGENTINTVKSIPQIPKAIGTAVMHPIRTVGAVVEGVKDKVGEYNSPTKFAEKVSTDPLGFGSDVIGAALLAKGIKDTIPTVKKAGASVIKGTPKAINKIAAPVRDYAGNKVQAIRQGAKSYWKQEVKAYGDTLDTLAKNPDAIPLDDLMQKMTKTMVDRKLYDPIQGKWVVPLNKVDAQFVKSYTDLSRSYKSNGKAPIGKIIEQYQKIRDSADISTPMGRDARKLAADVIDGVKNQINVPEFKAAQSKYADFRNNFDAIDGKIDVWGNPLKTGKGERFLTKSISDTKESRLIAKAIEEKTGQTLKGAKTLSVLHNLPGVKLIKR